MCPRLDPAQPTSSSMDPSWFQLPSRNLLLSVVFLSQGDRTKLRHAIVGRVGVAIMFAVCGAWSSRFFSEQSTDLMKCAPPVPFALLSVLLFLRTPTGILSVPLSVIVWLAAYITAMWLGMGLGSDNYTPMCIGGGVGGLGLVLCAAVWRHWLFCRRYLVGGAVIGGLAALPFGLWLKGYRADMAEGALRLPLQYSFAIWQGAIGTYLYIICTRKQVQDDGSR